MPFRGVGYGGSRENIREREAKDRDIGLMLFYFVFQVSLVKDISFGILNEKYDAAIVDSLRFGVCLKCRSQPQCKTFGTVILGKIQILGLKRAIEKSVVACRKKSISNKLCGIRKESDLRGCPAQIRHTCATVMSARTVHRKRKQSY